MSKDKSSLFAEGLKGIPQRIDAAIVNFTKSMNDAAKALNDFGSKANDKCKREDSDNEKQKS